jgi:hypothetical protein
MGRFNLDPDGVKYIAVCEPVIHTAFSFRLLFGDRQSRKLEKGKYRLHIKVSSMEGEPIRAVILINDYTIQLEKK